MIRALFISCLLGTTAWGNPLFDGADPHAMRIGTEYWLFPTEAHSKERIFAAYRSSDLKEWKREKTIFKLDDVPWVKSDGAPRHAAWAPAMIWKNNRFYFYYSVGPQSPGHPSRIGVATGDSPTGPFQDSGKPLLTGGNGFEAIDPMVFTDPADGKSYLYTGGSAGATLRVFEMAEDMVGFKGEVKTTTPPHFTEGPFMHVRNGIYYLSYSSGSWSRTDYSVHYATADSPTGPWKYRGKILGSDASRQGPGHHSFVENPAGESFIVYHRWETTEKPGPYSGSRKIAVEPIHYDPQGLIEPIRMTGNSPPAPKSAD